VIGLDSFAMNAPVLALTLVGGALADRADRRRVIAFFQSIQMLCPTAIVILLVAGTIQPWMIVALSVVVGVTDALSMPSFQSIVPSIVERNQIAVGITLNSTQFNLSRIVGPALAGILMSSVGAIACFVASALSYLPFIGVALWILPRRATRTGPQPDRDPGETMAGIREILAQSSLRGALLTVLTGSVLCGPLLTFVPVLAREAFHGTAGYFAMAMAAFGFGGLLGGAALLGVPAGVDRRWVASLCATAQAATLICIAVNPWATALPVLLVFAAAFMTAANTAANSLLQMAATPGLLGRTVSLYSLAMRGGLSVGALLAGAVIGMLGPRPAFLIAGATAVAIQGLLMRSWLKGTERVRQC
jgi:predicted MFS family arabinose efflux permease